jgi:hypothetical protein
MTLFHLRDLRNAVGSRLCNYICNYILEYAVKELCVILDRKLRVRSEPKARKGSMSKRMLQLTFNASNTGLKYTKTPPFDIFAMLYRHPVAR